MQTLFTAHDTDQIEPSDVKDLTLLQLLALMAVSVLTTFIVALSFGFGVLASVVLAYILGAPLTLILGFLAGHAKRPDRPAAFEQVGI